MMSESPILLVEDDVLIGMMLVDMIESLGLAEPVQVTSVAGALAAIGSQPFSAALVDVNLGDEKGWPVADALAAQNIPFAFTTGGGDAIPAQHAHRKLVSKPFRITEIEAVIAEFSEG